MSEKKKFDVNSVEEFANLMKGRRQAAKEHKVNPKTTHAPFAFAKHVEMANLVVKVINVIDIDPIIQKVITMRILNPVLHGSEKSHMAIAIELGLTEDEVRNIEQAGITILDSYLQKICAEDFVNTFNRDKKLATEVKKIQLELGKSAQGGRPQGGKYEGKIIV